MRKIISLLLTACLAAALLTGCGGKASEGGAAAKKTMVIGDTTFVIERTLNGSHVPVRFPRMAPGGPHH